jgi:1-acyl-sn-glycerol-3-phosphate acyltransferase
MIMHPSDIPPIKNYPLHFWRVFAKWLSFFCFGVGTVFLVTAIFPVMRICLHPRKRFQKYARRFVSLTMRFFIGIMSFIGVVKMQVDNRKAYSQFSSKIIVANHPSLLDVVFLLSLIPNANCIVNGYLSRTLVRGVIRQLYIPNSLDFAEMSKACVDSLHNGDCIIIFPEGTRTRRTGEPVLKRGAARLALQSGCGIIPIHIGGNDKYGLGKHDSWGAYNHTERYLYKITMGTELFPKNYAASSMPISVRALTADIKLALFAKPQ